MPMIISHNHPRYQRIIESNPRRRNNGAYHYSREILRNIIPNVKTDRSWVTINIPGKAADHAIVFIHNNKHPENYDWLEEYEDLILVCGVPETCDKVKHLGVAVYLPLSIDTEEVSTYATPNKDKNAAFAGRAAKAKEAQLPKGTDILAGMNRPNLLAQMARYKKIYAVGRTAIEARALGCEILPYDPRYPDPSVWEVTDNKEAAEILQRLLDSVDKKEGVSFRPAQTEGGIPDGVQTRGEQTEGVQKDGGLSGRGSERRGRTEEGKRMTEDSKAKQETEWRDGFPERNGIYRCRINGEDIRPLMHKRCTINNRSRWMELDGHDAVGSIQFENKRLGAGDI